MIKKCLFSIVLVAYSGLSVGMDAALETCIKAKVKDSSLSASTINELSCTNKGIKSIAGIENLSSLMALDLSNNLISDFSPILRLKAKSLRVLYISKNRIPCAELESLKSQLSGLLVLGLDRSNCVNELPKPTPTPTPTPKQPGKPGPKIPPRPPRPPMPPAPPRPPAPPSDKPKPGRQGEGSNKGLSGVEVYQKECAICHGKEGEGTERGYPLKFVKKRFAELVTRKGRKIPPEYEIDMPAYDEEIVSRQQMNEMLDYLSNFPQPQSGKQLYFYYCQNCHGDRGYGGVSREGISSESYKSLRKYTRKGKHRGAMWELWRRDEFMPAWGAGEITDDDVQKISDYLHYGYE